MSWWDDIVNAALNIVQVSSNAVAGIYNQLSSAYGYVVTCAADTLARLQVDLAGAPQAVINYFTNLINLGWVYGGTVQVVGGNQIYVPSLGIIVKYYGTLQQLKNDMPNIYSGQKIVIREEVLKELGRDLTSAKTGDHVSIGSGGSWVEITLGILGSIGCGFLAIFTVGLAAPICLAGVWGAVIVAEVTKQPDATVVTDTESYQIVRTADNRTIKIDKTTGEATEIGGAAATPLGAIFDAVKWVIIALAIVAIIYIVVIYIVPAVKGGEND